MATHTSEAEAPMLRSVEELEGYAIGASDSVIGAS